MGNKIDLQRIISNEDGVKYAKEKKMKYYEVSAKTGFNIKEIFDELYKDVYILKKENDNFLLRRMTQEKTKLRYLTMLRSLLNMFLSTLMKTSKELRKRLPKRLLQPSSYQSRRIPKRVSG